MSAEDRPHAPRAALAEPARRDAAGGTAVGPAATPPAALPPVAAPPPPLAPAEVEAAAAVHAAGFAGPGAGRPWSAEEIAGFCAGPGAFALLSPDRAAPDGLLLGRAMGPEAELATLAVAPSARRRGCARALLAAFAARARLLGAEEAFLEVAEGNAAARALYRAAGWREVGRRRRYYRRGDGRREDAVIMNLILTQ